MSPPPPPPISWINTAHAQTDSTAPTAAFSDVDNGVIGTEQSVLLTFSEAVTDLTASDFSTSAGVTGIRVSDPDSDQTTYTIAFTPSSQAIVLRLAANSVMDTAAIPNEGPARLVEQALRATDPDMPSLVGTYASIAAGEINTRQMLTFTFSEPVTGLTVDAFTIGGGEVNSITPSSGYHTTYTLTLTPTSTGQVVLRLLANSVTDRDGNTGPGIPATLTTFSLGAPDTTAPTVDFGTIDVGVIGTRQTHTIRFNQIVTGFAATDITATGATVDGVSGSGDTWSINFTPTAASFTLTLAADSVSDTAATPNTGPATEPAAARSVSGSAVLSADADLATLSITDNNGNPVTPNEAIAPDTLTYTATAPSDTTSVTITVTAADSNAEVDLDSLGTNTENFGFRDAMQSFAIEITAADGTTMKLYRLTITRAAPPNTAPVIQGSGAVNYAENGAGSVATYTATDDENNTITWEITGTDAGFFTLAPTSGVLTFRTVPDYETKSTYSVTVTATDDGTPNMDDTLDVTVTLTNVDEDGAIGAITGSVQVGQTLTSGTVTDPDGGVTGITYTWQSADGGAFDDITGATTAATYTLAATDEGKTIRVIATYTDTLGGGKMVTSVPTVAVVAATVTLSADANLSALTLSAGTLPTFAAATIRYTVSVGNDVASVTVTPTVADDGASVTVDGTAVARGVASEPIDLTVGANPIAIVVTAQDGTTEKTYTVTIDRGAPLTPFAVTIPALGKSTVDNRASVKIDFGRAVTGLAIGDFSVSNGAVNSIAPAAGSNTAYIVVYTPITTGAVTLTLAANAVTDGDGNPNLAASATGTAAVAAAQDTSQPSFTATTTMAGLTTAEFDEDKFELGIATLLTISVGDVSIISIAAGSVVVEYEVVADTDAERDARAAALSAATQSELRNAIDQNIPSNATVTTVIGESTAVAAVKVILPEVVRAMADSTVSVIARRIEQATAPGQAAATLTLDGRALALTALANAGSLSDALNSQGVGETLASTTRALADGSWQLNRVLGNSAFVLPIATTDHAWINRLAFWGGGDYRNLSGKGGALDWDGKLVSARLGADARVADTLLAGLTISWQHGTFGYDDADALRGTYDVEQTSIHPYLGWSALDGRLDLWATVGYGWGEVEIDKQRATGQVADLTTTTVGGGGSARLLESNAGTLRLKGEIVQTRADVDANADMITELTVDARRLRLTLEGTQEHQFADGSRLMPTVEVGLRHDTGDGRTGLGAEFGGSLRFSDPSSGLTIESRGRVLLGHSGDYNDWGLGGTVRFEPGINGRGLAVSLQPSYGATASRVSELWTQEAAVVPTSTAATTPQGGQMDIDISYGLDWTESFLTPYTRLSLTNTHTQAYRLGTRLQLEDGLIFSLEALRQESLTQAVDHGILLKLDLNW